MMCAQFFRQKGDLLTETAVSATATVLVCGAMKLSDKVGNKNTRAKPYVSKDEKDQSPTSTPSAPTF